MHTLLADTVVVTVNLGSFHWAITQSQLIYWGIAALIGLAAEFIVGWRLPLGILGAILAALGGIWLVTNVILFNIPGDPTFYGVPIVKSLIGAIILVALWHLVTMGTWRGRGRYYRRAAL